MRRLRMMVIAMLLGMMAGCGTKESAPDIDAETLRVPVVLWY